MTRDGGRSRRDFLGTGSAALAGMSLSPLAAVADHRPRVGIVGGGLAGITCAWLLDGVADAVLFEARPVLGGHAHTVPVDVDGHEVQADVGAQFFARGPQPTYVRLLEILGLASEAVAAEMTITITESGGTKPRFVSPAAGRAWTVLPRWNRRALWAFFVFALAARRFTQSGDWLVPVQDWLERLPVADEEREGVLLPLLSAMIGCSVEEARALSARGALVFIGKALPERLLDPFRYSVSLIGLGGNAERIAQACGNLTTHLGSPVASVSRGLGGGFRLRNEEGLVEDVDALVLAAPPHAARPLLSRLRGHERAAALLDAFEYFEAEISLHRDPVYMPAERRFWSAYNPHLEAGRCEASIWYGALLPTPVELFKSWATARSAPPKREVLRRRFRHPLVTPEFVRAQARLAQHQGRGGVWLAGSYTREVDSQETALLSAVEVVRQLAPEAPNLQALSPAPATPRATGAEVR